MPEKKWTWNCVCPETGSVLFVPPAAKKDATEVAKEDAKEGSSGGYQGVPKEDAKEALFLELNEEAASGGAGGEPVGEDDATILGDPNENESGGARCVTCAKGKNMDLRTGECVVDCQYEGQIKNEDNDWRVSRGQATSTNTKWTSGTILWELQG